MTVFAGIYSYDPALLVSDEMCRALHDTISRDPSDQRHSYRDDRCFLVKIDIGAYRQPAYHQSGPDSVAMLVGEPLLPTGGGPHRPRGEDLATLHRGWLNKSHNLYRQTHGSFAAVHYDGGSGRLSLVADKIGGRCLYYCYRPGLVVFATALRVLESLPFVPKAIDLQGVSEQAAFGYPLYRRTPYADISCLDGAEIVDFTADGERSDRYWRWHDIDATDRPIQEVVDDFHRRFVSAVARRLRPDEHTVDSFLSGGLDSRCIVMTLRELGKSVHSFTFSAPHLLDSVLSRAFAARAGCHHHPHDVAPPAFVHPAHLLPEALREDLVGGTDGADYPHLVWSGDGGSVTVGYVYLDEQIGHLLQSESARSAVDYYLQKQKIGLPATYLSRSARQVLPQLPALGVLESLSAISAAISERSFFLFLMLNDQRRHLTGLLEDIDLARLELQLPFFDSDVIEAACRIPVSFGLYHRFYYEWLQAFPDSVRTVPWQAYPNHLPCPLPLPTGSTQWETWSDSDGPVGKRPKSTASWDLAKAAGSPRFPSALFSMPRLRLARMLSDWGVRDYDWLFKKVLVFSRYFEMAESCQARDLLNRFPAARSRMS